MSSDQLIDTVYAAKIILHHAPARIRATCLLNGVRPPSLSAPFTFCDFGCGRGRSLAAFAAASPHGEFIGVDILPEHVEDARAFAEQAGVSNVRYLCGSFADIAAGDVVLPPLDYALLNGVYSWVSDAARDHLLAALGGTLKPGGVACASYNVLPGAYAMAAMRNIILAQTEGAACSDLERARRGRDFVRLLYESKALFFRYFPGAGHLAEDIINADLHYLVHEYISPSWAAMYLPYIVESFERVGMSFVGPLAAAEDLFEINAPHALVKSLAGAKNRAHMHASMDIFRGNNFRTDVFIKQPAVSVAPANSIPDDARFSLWQHPGQAHAPRDLPVAPGFWQSRAIFREILDQLQHQTRTPAQLRAALPHASPKEIDDGLRFLYADQRLWPSVSETTPWRGEPSRTRFSYSCDFNAHAVDTRIGAEAEVPQAALRLGSTIWIHVSEALFVKGLVEVGLAALPAWSQAHIDASRNPFFATLKLAPDGTLPRDRIERYIKHFLDGRLAQLVEIGVLNASQS